MKWFSQHIRLSGTIRPEKHEPISSPHICLTAFASIFRFPRAFLCHDFNLVVCRMAFSLSTGRAERPSPIIDLGQYHQSIDQQNTTEYPYQPTRYPAPLTPIEHEFPTGEKRTNDNEGDPEDMEKRNLRALMWRLVFQGIGIVARHIPD